MQVRAPETLKKIRYETQKRPKEGTVKCRSCFKGIAAQEMDCSPFLKRTELEGFHQECLSYPWGEANPHHKTSCVWLGVGLPDST